MRLLPIFVALAPILANANTFSTDVSDLWWNPAEVGQGFTVTQQGSVIFITFYIYDPATNKPTWVVATEGFESQDSSGSLTFSGGVYATIGPAGHDTATQVGDSTFRLTSVNAATFTYTINGQQYVKSLERETFAYNDPTGQYLGAAIGSYSKCPGITDGYAEEPATLQVSLVGLAFSMVATTASGTCTYTGTYTQEGHLGAVVGNEACTGGFAASFTAQEIEATTSGFTGRGTLAAGACSWTGRFGGLRRGP